MGEERGGEVTREREEEGQCVCVFVSAGEHLSFCLPEHVYRPMM